MSRFYEFVRRMSESPGDSPRAGVARNGDAHSEIDEIVSALDTPFDASYSPITEPRNHLSNAPVDTIEITPEMHLVVHSDPGSLGADRYRFLRMRLKNLWDEGKLKCLMITSPVPNDGKTTVAMNLATALLDKGKQSVVLIDGDLHHCHLSRQLSIGETAGLGDCLTGNINPVSLLRRVEPLGFYFLSAGKLRGHPTEMLQGDGLARVMQTFSRTFDWVIVDTPPVLPLTDASLLAHQTDASLLVIRAGETPKKNVNDAIAIIGKKHIVGIVLNGAEHLTKHYTSYSRYYQKAQED